MCKKGKQNNLTHQLFVESFRDSVSQAFDCLVDFSENMIDSFIDDPIVQAIPIVKLGVTAYNGAKSFYNYFQQKKLISFLGKLNSCTDEKNFIKMKEKMLNKPNYLLKESELTLALLDKTIETEKSILLAECFASLIKEEFSEKIYTEVTLIIDQIFLSDLDTIKIVKDGTNDDVKAEEISSLNRLVASGAIRSCVLNGNGVSFSDYELTSIGEYLSDVVTKYQCKDCSCN